MISLHCFDNFRESLFFLNQFFDIFFRIWFSEWDFCQSLIFKERSSNISAKSINKAIIHLEKCVFLRVTYTFRIRSSHRSFSWKRGALGNFTKFTGKHLCQSVFFDKVAGLQLYYKRNSGTGVFLWIFRNF